MVGHAVKDRCSFEGCLVRSNTLIRSCTGWLREGPRIQPLCHSDAEAPFH